MLALKKIRLILIVFSIISLAGTGCSLLDKLGKGPTKEEVAEQKKIEQMHKKQVADEAAAKEKSKKKAVADEDAIQLHKIETINAPRAEKLSEEVPAGASTAGADNAAAVPIAVLPGGAASSAPRMKIPTEPNVYLVTVEKKNKTHPFFGRGDNRGFVLNGHQGQHIIAKRGAEVTFKVRTGVQHDFYLSRVAKGWGASPFVDGVEGQFTYNGDVSFNPTKDTPNDLYYGCRNHNSMGGRIVVVAPNADIAAVMKKLDKERVAAEKNAKSVVNKEVKPQKVSQKIAYVAMMLQFKGKALPADQKTAIQEMLDKAKRLEKKGELAAALAAAGEAGAMITGGGKKAGPTKEELAEQKEGLTDHMITLEAFIDSHKASWEQTKKNHPEKLVDYDRDLVEKLVTEAVQLSTKNKFVSAKKLIKKAERLVIKALNEMLNSQTIVYDLNFATPDEEYAYEVTQYEGYLELIPVAIEVKKPRAGSIKLMETYVGKGKFFREKADEAAKAGRWEEAMVVIRDATIEVRRGLRLLGVSM
ncbi:MAG: hypothetical protein OEM38_02485 [Gammaproteobacteria bacterium]|nr:hypothetical protein [Gammaproteobacteria bacterium]